ncbi:MAG: hypothetical protein RHS_3420 [Robinsoniella sp. RHS]|nr:MAG: hypothetical protein RHS_3420 [Robinsoniella sp. RHS]
MQNIITYFLSVKFYDVLKSTFDVMKFSIIKYPWGLRPGANTAGKQEI